MGAQYLLAIRLKSAVVGAMDEKRSEFLTKMIDILDRLHETSVAKGEPLLASVLAIARGEAEDALRHAGELEALMVMREQMSSRDSWRPEESSGEIAA